MQSAAPQQQLQQQKGWVEVPAVSAGMLRQQQQGDSGRCWAWQAMQLCAASDAPAVGAASAGGATAVAPIAEVAGTAVNKLLGGTAGQAAAAAGDIAAADHLLLLFVLEHLLLLAMLIVYWCIPSEPAAVRLIAGAPQELEKWQDQQDVGVQQQQRGPFARVAGNNKMYTNPLFVPVSE
jgi:hypothetical protein